MLIPAPLHRGGVVATAVAVSALVAAPALAHDSVIGATPQDEAVVSMFPDTVTLEFSGEVQDGFNTLALSHINDGRSEVLYTGEPEIDGRFVSLDLPNDLDAQPGEYKVGFQIVSSDGHSTKGKTSFTFNPVHTEGQSGTSSDEASKDPVVDAAEGMSMSSKVLLALFGVLVIGGAAVMALTRNRRNPGTNRAEKES